MTVLFTITAEDVYRFAHAARMRGIETDNPRQFKARKKEYAKTLKEYRDWWKDLSTKQQREIQNSLATGMAKGINPVMSSDPDLTAEAIRNTAVYLDGED
jgi:hypothetical protein